MAFYCYCPLHLQAFANSYGGEVRRETIIYALLNPCTEPKLRAAWLSFLGETIGEAARRPHGTLHNRTRDTLRRSGADTQSGDKLAAGTA